MNWIHFLDFSTWLSGVIFSLQALEDIRQLKQSGNVQILRKISRLIHNIAETPFTEIGKPEPLKHQLSGFWSRRITQEHRLVYEVREDEVEILSALGHYEA